MAHTLVDRRVRLALFMTRGMSLATWDRLGMFEREVALYRELRQYLGSIALVTYGDRSDLDFGDRLQGIEILCNRWKLPANWYAWLIPVLHAPTLRRADVFRTNQTYGAEVALASARLHHKRLIARGGYMWSDSATRAGLERLSEARRARRIESKVFRSAQRVVVTTPIMRDYAVRQFQLSVSKVQVIPNYVLTDVFSPNGGTPVANRLCFVGRLEADKNPLALVRACAGLDWELVMIGDGSLRMPIEETAAQLDVKLKLLGNIAHTQLPTILRTSAVFLLISPHEGHPKTLIEAMSCGLPVIGTDSPGIRELIRHGETGYLCSNSADSIRMAVQTLLADEGLRQRLGRNARQYVLDNFTLGKVVQMELDVLSRVMEDNPL